MKWAVHFTLIFKFKFMSTRFKIFKRDWRHNLTLHYTVGLSLLALLTITSQVLIQTEMYKQKSDQETIRLLSDLKNQSKEMRQKVVEYKLRGRPYQDRFFNENVVSTFELVAKTHSLFVEKQARDKYSDWSLNPVLSLQIDLRNLNTAIEEIRRTLNSSLSEREEPVESHLKRLLEIKKTYNLALSSTIENYEFTSKERLRDLRFIEIIFMLFTLLVLFLEAIFIFKPVVQRLNHALRVRSDFISRISHEIRNPLNSILGMSHLLQETVQSAGERRLIKRMQRSGRTLLSILENVLEFSSLSEGKSYATKNKTSVLKIVERSLELVSPQLGEKRLNCHLYLDPNLPYRIMCDDTKIEQILFNLLNNAVKFTTQGFVCVGVQWAGESKDKYLRLIVEDTGTGIPKEKRLAIFSAFTQADESIRRRHGGVGLGLSIVRQLANLLEGSVSIDESYDKGARFVADLPVEALGTQTLKQKFASLDLKIQKLIVYTKSESYGNALIKMISAFPVEVEVVSTLESLCKTDSNDSIGYVIDFAFDGSNLPDYFDDFREASKDRDVIYLVFEQDFDKILKSTDMALHNELALKPLLITDLKNFIQTGKLGINTEKLPSVAERFNLKLVILDDDEDNLEILERFLRPYCSEIHSFSSASQALRHMKENDFDILLTDMEMPQQNGFQVAEAIRRWEKTYRKSPHIILAASAYRYTELKENSKWVLFDGHVEKPIVKNKLLSVLRAYNRKPVKSVSILDRAEPHLRDLVPQYIDKKALALNKLILEFDKIDLQEVRRFGHQLKGTGKSYGLEQIGQLGASLEKQSVQKDLVEVKTILQELRLRFDSLKL